MFASWAMGMRTGLPTPPARGCSSSSADVLPRAPATLVGKKGAALDARKPAFPWCAAVGWKKGTVLGQERLPFPWGAAFPAVLRPHLASRAGHT